MSFCQACNRRGTWQGHHPTGRNAPGEYFDPEFTVNLCHNHHTLCHDDWHTLGVANAPAGATRQQEVELRLRRLAATLARLDRGKNILLGDLASVLVDCADDLSSPLD